MKQKSKLSELRAVMRCSPTLALAPLIRDCSLLPANASIAADDATACDNCLLQTQKRENNTEAHSSPKRARGTNPALGASADMTAKRVSSNEDKPAVRVLRQRELISQMHHENEVLRLDMTRQLRESKRATGGAGAREIARLQEQAAVYIRKIQLEKAKVEELEKQVLCVRVGLLQHRG